LTKSTRAKAPKSEPLTVRPKPDVVDAQMMVGDPIHDANTNPLNATTAAQRTLIADSNPAMRLSESNAKLALKGPEGSSPSVAGPSGAGADITFKDSQGVTVFSREVKSTQGEWDVINSHFSKAVSQIGKGNAGDIFFQVPNSTTVADATTIARRVAGNRVAAKADYAKMTLTIANEEGRILYSGPAVP
jgi:hypothetical protein